MIVTELRSCDVAGRGEISQCHELVCSKWRFYRDLRGKMRAARTLHYGLMFNLNPSMEKQIMNRIIRYQQPSGIALFPALARRSLWSGVESEIDRVFENALADFAAPAVAPRFPVDLYEDKDNLYVRAELPGVTREAINVEMVEDYLNLNATRKSGDESFSLARSITIPEAVQADKVSANYENGVLTVTLPKQEQVKPRKVTVSVS